MVAEKTIKKGFKKLVEDYKQQLLEDHFKSFMAQRIADVLAKMAVGWVIKKQREEEIYLSFIKQERM